MMSMNTNLLESYLIEEDNVNTKNVEYFAGMLRVLNFAKHFYDYVADEPNVSMMSVLYSNMINLSLRKVVDHECKVD